jgi:proline iminopeptidase
LAIAYAVEFPERVLGLVGISGGVIHKDKAWSEQYKRLKEAGKEQIPDFDYPPNMDVNEALNASWREYVRQPHLLREIADLQVPSLFLFGAADIRPSWPVEQLVSLMPGGRFVSIQGAGHAIWLTHDQELRCHLRKFVASIKKVA